MAQTTVSLKNNSGTTTVLQQPFNVIYGRNSIIVSTGTNGIFDTTYSITVPSAPTTKGLVIIGTFAYSVNGNSLYRYNVQIASSGVPGLSYNNSYDLSLITYNNPDLFTIVNGSLISSASINNNNNLYSEPIQVNASGTPIDAGITGGPVNFTVTPIFQDATGYLATDSQNIYVLLLDNRIAKISMSGGEPILGTALTIITTAPVINGSVPTTNLSFGLTYQNGYLYTFDAANKYLTYVNATTGVFGSIPDPSSGFITSTNGSVVAYTTNSINYLFITRPTDSGGSTIGVLQMNTANPTIADYYTNSIFPSYSTPIHMMIPENSNSIYALTFYTNFGGSFTYNINKLDITVTSGVPVCFLEGTFIYTKEGYRLIETLKKGDLINTFKDNYVPIDTIIKEEMVHHASQERNKKQLFKLSYPEYPQLLKDLYITGAHSILVGKLTEKEHAKIIEDYGKIYATDLFDRLPAYIDEKAKIHEPSGKYTIYHIALENENMNSNYGIFANGLLVESLSKNDCVNRFY